jgi:hypothetical protein
MEVEPVTAIKYRTADLDGFKIFYREAGTAGAPKLIGSDHVKAVGQERDEVPEHVAGARETVEQ